MIKGNDVYRFIERIDVGCSRYKEPFKYVDYAPEESDEAIRSLVDGIEAIDTKTKLSVSYFNKTNTSSPEMLRYCKSEGFERDKNRTTRVKIKSEDGRFDGEVVYIPPFSGYLTTAGDQSACIKGQFVLNPANNQDADEMLEGLIRVFNANGFEAVIETRLMERIVLNAPKTAP